MSLFEEIVAIVRSAQPTKPDPRDPDHSRPGIFATHNCWKCKDGQTPCAKGSPRNCDNLHARND